jgi:hypothetical protein
VFLEQYGEAVVPPRTGKRGRPREPFKRWPKGSAYATVNKTYRKGRVADVQRKLVHGTQEDLDRALASSAASRTINTAFVERHNGTDRTYNARKRRKTYEFSKDLAVHIAVSWWVVFCYNFHQPHRGLAQRQTDDSYRHRTPAMARGLEDRRLTVAEIVTTQVVGFTPKLTATPAAFRCRDAVAHAP